MSSNKIRISNAEIGKFYFRLLPNGTLEAVKLTSITQFCGIIENAFGGKTMVPLHGELFIDQEPEVISSSEKVIDTIDDSNSSRKITSRTGIMTTVDTLLTEAPPHGYSIKEMIGIIMQSGRSILTVKQLRYLLHTRIWVLRKRRGFDNIAARPRRYKLSAVPQFKETIND